MTRRKTKNRSGIARIEGVPSHGAWISFVCVRCNAVNRIFLGKTLLAPQDAHEKAVWVCGNCHFVHSRQTDLPFKGWPKAALIASGVAASRFWSAFFRGSTEHPESYWKQCNACGRILPFNVFSRHSGWGPLERQMECRSCKAVINARLNPRRTKQQLHEGSLGRRGAEMLLEGENAKIDLKDLFKRFGSRCFKTGRALSIRNRGTWAVDHILPSRYLYPLAPSNAALLSREANENKRDRWPSEFYTNQELVRLAKITGADLSLLASPKPVMNQRIDVDACVSRALRVREHSNLSKRVRQLRRFLESYGLIDKLSNSNRKLLGLK